MAVADSCQTESCTMSASCGATVRCFIDKKCAVCWIPSVTSAYGGDVARRAALKIPDLPKHALEAVLEAVKVGDTQIRMLTPAVLRQSLRKAGKVVKPSEVAAILEYVMSSWRSCMVCTLHTCALVMSLACPGKASKKARRVLRSSSMRAQAFFRVAGAVVQQGNSAGASCGLGKACQD
ncbi:hypothetical protein WJX77_008421 [Trebouxia sp. C0004]